MLVEYSTDLNRHGTDPYAWWCGRGGVARRPSIPIQGPVLESYQFVQRYTERRLRRWLVRKHKQRGKSGVRLYSDEYLYEQLDLHRLPHSKAELLSAKAY